MELLLVSFLLFLAVLFAIGSAKILLACRHQWVDYPDREEMAVKLPRRRCTKCGKIRFLWWD